MNKRRARRGEALNWVSSHAGHDGAECLIWPFGRHPNGYTVIFWRYRMTNVSRVMCYLRHGPPPSPEHEARHLCGKGHLGCVNPSHMKWGTRSQNAMDMHMHGTARVGMKNPACKLTSEQVSEIRALAGTIPQHKIGEMFGVRQTQISRIINHRRRAIA